MHWAMLRPIVLHRGRRTGQSMDGRVVLPRGPGQTKYRPGEGESPRQLAPWLLLPLVCLRTIPDSSCCQTLMRRSLVPKLMRSECLTREAVHRWCESLLLEYLCRGWSTLPLTLRSLELKCSSGLLVLRS